MHALTVRLPETVYKAAKQLAARDGMSINRLIQEAIIDRASRTTESRLQAAYDMVADDKSECDVERFLAVQAAALLDD